MSKYSKGYYVLSKHIGNTQPYHWVLKAPNHEVILTSETYSSKHASLNGIESVRENCPFDKNYSREIAKDGSPYFNLLAKNHQIIGTSEMYSSVAARENGIAAVKEYGVTQVLEDKTGASGEGGLAVLGVVPVVTSKPNKNEKTGRYA